RIDGIGQMLKSSLRGNITLTYDLPSDVWPVEIDIGEFELALVNIAVNARNVTLARSAKVGKLEGQFVALALSNTGSGVAPEHIPKIFEPFFTTKAVG